jgi:hypothetical protein
MSGRVPSNLSSRAMPDPIAYSTLFNACTPESNLLASPSHSISTAPTGSGLCGTTAAYTGTVDEERES